MVVSAAQCPQVLDAFGRLPGLSSPSEPSLRPPRSSPRSGACSRSCAQPACASRPESSRAATAGRCFRRRPRPSWRGFYLFQEMSPDTTGLWRGIAASFAWGRRSRSAIAHSLRATVSRNSSAGRSAFRIRAKMWGFVRFSEPIDQRRSTERRTVATRRLRPYMCWVQTAAPGHKSSRTESPLRSNSLRPAIQKSSKVKSTP